MCHRDFWITKLMRPRIDVKIITAATRPERIFSFDLIGLPAWIYQYIITGIIKPICINLNVLNYHGICSAPSESHSIADWRNKHRTSVTYEDKNKGADNIFLWGHFSQTFEDKFLHSFFSWQKQKRHSCINWNEWCELTLKPLCIIILQW